MQVSTRYPRLCVNARTSAAVDRPTLQRCALLVAVAYSSLVVCLTFCMHRRLSAASHMPRQVCEDSETVSMRCTSQLLSLLARCKGVCLSRAHRLSYDCLLGRLPPTAGRQHCLVHRVDAWQSALHRRTHIKRSTSPSTQLSAVVDWHGSAHHLRLSLRSGNHGHIN